MKWEEFMKTISFFGHSNLKGVNLRNRLEKVIKSYIASDVKFLIGVHGEFDRLALSICRDLQRTYSNINITVIFTSLNVLKKNKEELCSTADLYADVETMVYDIEEVYFKQRINISNRKMIDNSDLIICYVDMNISKSGAKNAILYAMKNNKEIINLFKEEDVNSNKITKEEFERITSKK